MIPEGMTADEANAALAKIAAKHKAAAAASDRIVTGAEVSYLIAKDWHDLCGVPFVGDPPPGMEGPKPHPVASPLPEIVGKTPQEVEGQAVVETMRSGDDAGGGKSARGRGGKAART